MAKTAKDSQELDGDVIGEGSSLTAEVQPDAFMICTPADLNRQGVSLRAGDDSHSTPIEDSDLQSLGSAPVTKP